VVLGADHPLGLHLVLGLEAQGYIVIASVSSPDAVEALEAKSRGYVRVLVLDPREVKYLSL
jgi:nucleoside-diphosphate-sugar epimerase